MREGVDVADLDTRGIFGVCSREQGTVEESGRGLLTLWHLTPELEWRIIVVRFELQSGLKVAWTQKALNMVSGDSDLRSVLATEGVRPRAIWDAITKMLRVERERHVNVAAFCAGHENSNEALQGALERMRR
ncbi:hypothetical protein HOI83_00175 [Candidatus Uhrbacteria bacterium]|nr:hypothetical protein [Candidatus Uhrbacteria bacterium]